MVMKGRKKRHEVLKGNPTENFPENCEQTPPSAVVLQNTGSHCGDFIWELW